MGHVVGSEFKAHMDLGILVPYKNICALSLCTFGTVIIL